MSWCVQWPRTRLNYRHIPGFLVTLSYFMVTNNKHTTLLSQKFTRIFEWFITVYTHAEKCNVFVLYNKNAKVSWRILRHEKRKTSLLTWTPSVCMSFNRSRSTTNENAHRLEHTNLHYCTWTWLEQHGWNTWTWTWTWAHECQRSLRKSKSFIKCHPDLFDSLQRSSCKSRSKQKGQLSFSSRPTSTDKIEKEKQEKNNRHD